MRILPAIVASLASFVCSRVVYGQISENYEPVALVHKTNSNISNLENEDVDNDKLGKKPVILATPREVRELFLNMHAHEEEARDLQDSAMPHVDYTSEEGRSYEAEYDENDQGDDDGDGSEEISTEIVETSSQQNVTGSNRTKLYPIGRLWERSPVDFWSVINAAISCLWSGLGLECFSFRVVPMVKSLMGYQPMSLPSSMDNPYFVSPRVSDDAIEEEDENKTEPIAETDENTSRKRKHHTLKLAKWALYGFAAAKTVIVPLLSALSVVSGKALIFSLLAGVLTVAIAWNGLFGRNADRRIYDADSKSSYYPYSTLYN